MIAIDLLGLAHEKFSLQNCFAALPKKCAVGVFDDPFGPVIPKLKKLIQQIECPAVRIHAHWSNAHAIVSIAKLRRKLKAYQDLALEFPAVQIYVSHSCEYEEHKLSEIKARVSLTRALAPRCIPVNSVYKGLDMTNAITERHGNVLVDAGDIVSMDGTEFSDLNLKVWLQLNKHALFKFGWRSSFNLREKGKPAPPPMQRTRGPTAAEIAEVVSALKQ